MVRVVDEVTIYGGYVQRPYPGAQLNLQHPFQNLPVKFFKNALYANRLVLGRCQF